jgi:DNA-binding CsgD family transcriptional regulator
MDRDLVVEAAAGESILRLPWFEDELFVGRRLPDIAEMPKPVRKLCVENYSGALAGERRRFTFISYGHAYTVDAVPVRGEGGPPESVLAIATPSPSSTRAAEAYEGLAGRLDRTAAAADERAGCSRHLGRSQAETAARRIAERAREDAARARANARRTRGGGPLSADSHAISPRETEVLDLASHGLNIAEIGEQLCISPATVKNHFEHIYVKLGVSNRVAAVAMGLRHGLIN